MKIGIFDSGLGGLSVWKELDKLLPAVPMVYVADSGRCPYGPKPQEEIVRYSREITDFLIEEGCSLMVVACNTATAAAISILRTEYDLPFVGMEPAIKPAAQASSSGVIGILATEGTFRGNHF
ncbi:MAG: aspartate/glutamate racemase family protein, partial [Bacteroidota bacterium]